MGRAQTSEVGNGGAIQPSQPKNLVPGQPFRTTARLPDDCFETVPIRLAVVGECAYLHAYLMDTDRIEIRTPEGLNLEMTLAGLGSRGAAAIIDTLIIVALALVVFLPFRNSGGSLPVRIMLIAAPTALFFGYHLAFETIGRRQSPGKRLLRLRVVQSDGSPIGAVGSLVRNLIRIVDFLPAFYLIGITAVFATTQNQRLGDLAAGAVVVMEPKPANSTAVLPSTPTALPEGWDVSAVTDHDIAVMRQFLDRREALDSDSRQQIAHRISSSLLAKVVRPADRHMTSEQTIETVLAIKELRG